MRGSVFVVGVQSNSKKINLTHCYRCGEKFKVGDKIFSKLNKTSKRYHILCAEKCNLTIPEIIN